MKKSILFLLSILFVSSVSAQQEDLLKQVEEKGGKREYVTNAFKSSRVINGQSMEMLPAGVLDVRILHRFGFVNDGIKELFGLDEAAMRMGFDYGITKNLTVGVGRSTFNKELDGFIKFRAVQQSAGAKSFPLSILWVSGITLNTTTWADPERKNYFSSRVGYYHEIIFGRKFSDRFSLQLSPVYVHRNLVDSVNTENDTWALGIGGRLKLSKRVAFVVDYHPILAGKQNGTYDPLSVGFDIETGGHVFQLHFSNATGMNERAFITQTTGRWGKGDIRFGFNLSRVFTIRKPLSARIDP